MTFVLIRWLSLRIAAHFKILLKDSHSFISPLEPEIAIEVEEIIYSTD